MADRFGCEGGYSRLACLTRRLYSDGQQDFDPAKLIKRNTRIGEIHEFVTNKLVTPTT